MMISSTIGKSNCIAPLLLGSLNTTTTGMVISITLWYYTGTTTCGNIIHYSTQSMHYSRSIDCISLVSVFTTGTAKYTI